MLTDAGLERDRGKVVAFVDDHQSISCEQLVRLVSAGQTLDHGDVDDARRSVLAAPDHADLAGCYSEMLAEPVTPLVDERLAVDEHERWDVVAGDDRAGHHRLPGAGWCDDDTSFIRTDGGDRVGLGRMERTVKGECAGRVLGPGVGDLEVAVEIRDEIDNSFDKSPR